MFRKAERRKAKLRLGLCGVTGSGKTKSALQIATGMGGRIAMIDTESGRGDFYSEDFKYDIVRLESPYTVEKYIDCIKNAEKEGYDILIIDSLSHAWSAEGGILSIVDKAGGNTFTNGWKSATPKYNSFVDAIISSKMHIIGTIRAKTDHSMETNEKGKIVPRRIGLAPIQRDNLEYEYTISINISDEQIAHVVKDMTQLFNQQYIRITDPGIMENMGIKLMEWLNKGIDIEEYNKRYCQEFIDLIKNSSNLIDLREIFEKAYKSNISQDDNLFKKIEEAKNEMKEKLSKTA